MKKAIKVIAFLGIASMALPGCTDKFEDFNTNPYAPSKGDPSLLMPSMIEQLMYVQQNSSQMIDQMVGTYGGYFTLTNRWGGQNYDTFNVSDDWNKSTYNTAFTNIYSNFFEIAKMTESDGHYYAIARLIKAATMMRVTDCYGSIPYSQVKDGQMYVAYDKEQEVYKHIINDLKEGVKTLGTFGNNGKPLEGKDAIYDGDYAKWAKLGNSYIMRAAMRIGDKESFMEAMNSPFGYIKTNSDNALMGCGLQRNPYELASAAWGDLCCNATIVDYMNGYNDPRREKYFTTSKRGQFDGMPAGNAGFEKGRVQGYSLPNFGTESAPAAIPVFVAAESEFLIAEAILKQWMTGDVKSHYEAGIRLSFEQWGASGVEQYLADKTNIPNDHKQDLAGFSDYDRKTQVKVAFDDKGTAEQKLEQIITQKWIANYPQGLEAWAEQRRTGYPEMTKYNANLGTAPINLNTGACRLRYPYTEKNLNKANYETAVSWLKGADNEATKLFWAK
ncbi:SusD/RagB family nutrient-binding outer membrane lipoprotein [uncultured Bacteroides sp.]|jgi:hypothetical protein|uniref:SusD/RagB family nutrient-binding outer membrane lipoprotein n=1 Tax=uncultured Bacteroides sp. TaxID=162156 RepID=UPI0025DF6513|nr:SusD/RagB family nutrient-binding outer membrane lipoprotein [uncultured Bacteroides sp.]